MHTSRTDLGLAIRRVVTDLTFDFAFPPVRDSQPSCDGSCSAPKARPLLTPVSTPFGNPDERDNRLGPGLHGFLDLLRGGEVWDLSPFSRLSPACP